MRGKRRFKVYDISALRGRVPTIFIENYLEDSDNIEMVSFLSGLHLSCGDFDLGVSICENIAEKANLDGDDLREKSIAVWNLYILSKVYIEQERFDKAYRALDNAERYWSKDMALIDGIDMYRVRNLEDLWIRRAFGYLMQGRYDSFESMIDKVMLKRYEFYQGAYEITGEVPIRDRCLLDCFEYSSYMCRNKEELKQAVAFIKTAIRYLGRVPIDNDYIEGKMSEKNGELKNAYDFYLKFYLANRPQTLCDTILYETCGSCAYFDTKNWDYGECKKNNIYVDKHKACSKYLGISIK